MPTPPCLEYKYVIIDSNLKEKGEVRSVWENGFNGNRKVMLTFETASKDSGVIKLRDKFNSYEEMVDQQTS